LRKHRLILAEIGKEAGKSKEERDPKVLLDLINRYYTGLKMAPITNLDDISEKHVTRGLKYAIDLDVHMVYPRLIQQKLVELGAFPPGLADSFYDNVREDICQRLVNNSRNVNWGTYYTSPNLDQETLQSNTWTIITSKAVQDFFEGEGFNMHKPSRINCMVSRFLRKYFGTDDINSIIPQTGRYGSGNGKVLPDYRAV